MSDELWSIDQEINALKEKKKKLQQETNEKFDGKKLASGLLSVSNPVLWTKDLASIFNIRKIIFYLLIIGSVYGYGYIKGLKGKPVHFDMRGKEATIALNEHKLHIMPDGTAQVEDQNGKVLKKIAVKDIPELKKALLPIGFDIKPFFTTGYGISKENSSMETGAGISLFKFYKLHLDSFLTNKGIYLGTDYMLTSNFSLISGIGKSFSDADTRLYFGGKFNF